MSTTEPEVTGPRSWGPSVDPQDDAVLGRRHMLYLGLVKAAVALWMLLYTAGAGYLLIDLWLSAPHLLCRAFGSADCATFPAEVAAATHAVVGGVLGAGVLGMVSFHRYVSMERTFSPEHAWGYFFAPLLGGVLGLITFALLQTGLMVFSGSSQADPGTFVANLGFLGVGFLAGFGWYSATRRIEKLVSRFFGGEGLAADPAAAGSAAGSAAGVREPDAVRGRADDAGFHGRDV